MKDKIKVIKGFIEVIMIEGGNTYDSIRQNFDHA